jgi:hypothetical protein
MVVAMAGMDKQLRVAHEFESLRDHPPHLLLATLQRRLLLQCARASGMHFEGLAQAGRALRKQIGNRLATKLRLIDEAHNLLRHLSPESCSTCTRELSCLLEPHSVGELGSAAEDTTASFGDASSIRGGMDEDSMRSGVSVAVGTDVPMHGAVEGFFLDNASENGCSDELLDVVDAVAPHELDSDAFQDFEKCDTNLGEVWPAPCVISTGQPPEFNDAARLHVWADIEDTCSESNVSEVQVVIRCADVVEKPMHDEIDHHDYDFDVQIESSVDVSFAGVHESLRSFCSWVDSGVDKIRVGKLDVGFLSDIVASSLCPEDMKENLLQKIRQAGEFAAGAGAEGEISRRKDVDFKHRRRKGKKKGRL